MKQCTKCGEQYPATAEFFYRHVRMASGLTPRCKKCINQDNREYRKTTAGRRALKVSYERHADERRAYSRGWIRSHPENNRAARHRHYGRRREWWREFTSGLMCEWCGSTERLHFHHRDPSEKEFEIGKMFLHRPMDKLFAEMRKCSVLCTFCHQTEHKAMRRAKQSAA